MADIHIVCIGKLKEKYWRDAQAEYTKRLSAFCRLHIIEKKEAALPKKLSPALIEKACAEESASILDAANGTLIALSPEGEKMTSEDFSALIKNDTETGGLTFAVGGSYGLDNEIKQRAKKVLSFSDMTMPHQLFRIVLLEQIYRAFMISRGKTYHK